MSRGRTICDRAPEEKVQPWELYNKVDEMVEVPMLCRTSNSEVVQIRQHLVECCVFLMITDLYVCHGHVRNRRQCRTAAQKLR